MSQKALAWSARRGFLPLPIQSESHLAWTSKCSSAFKRQRFSSRSLALRAADSQRSESPNGKQISGQLARKAKEKQADKDFFLDLLSSAATKRDAKVYLSRLKGSNNTPTSTKAQSQPLLQAQKPRAVRPEVNLGGFFGHARAVDDSPVFTQYKQTEEPLEDVTETIHTALVKLVAPEKLDDTTLSGIGQTLSQLSRLSMSPCIVTETDPSATFSSDTSWRKSCIEQADRVVAAIDSSSGAGARRLDTIFSTSKDGTPHVFLRELLLRPLRRGRIPVVVPIAYSTDTQTAEQITADGAILALTKELAGLNLRPSPDEHPEQAVRQSRSLQKEVSLDRLIILDPLGGIPFADKLDRNHVFINLEQEFDDINRELHQYPPENAASDYAKHLQNLELLRDALSFLPPTSSAIIITPADAANSSSASNHSIQVSDVGTRRQKNSLIHNLLTDKPAYSSSLPTGRLGRRNGASAPPVMSSSTFVKRGMPLTILPDPRTTSWVADNHGEPRLKLTDPRIDLSRLTHLIDDSFNRKLDVEDYLQRVNDRMAGVIIAGEYEGGAILTWEIPPGLTYDGSAASNARLVPYLDKFAVLKRSQGAGGVADVVFNAMVRGCFPNGVCWRSRRDNPVNKWYFERARGTWKIPDTNWTMFWTTEGVVEHDQTFQDYENVCRGVQPSWADNKSVID